jgi:hypothetical protein
MIADLAPAVRFPEISPVSQPGAEMPPECADTVPGGDLPPAKDAEVPPTKEQLKTRRVPSKRNREIYRQHVLLNRSQRDVAAEYDVAQPRVSAICKQVKRWLKSGQAELDHMSEEERFNLVTNESRMRLNLAFSESYKWLQVTGQPSEIRRVRPGHEDEPETTYRPPNPKSPFIAVMLRAAIELAKLDGAGQYGARFAAASNPQSAIRNPQSSYPPSELLSRGRGASGTYNDDGDEGDDESYDVPTGISAQERQRIVRRGVLKKQNNCYRALAAAAGLAGEDAELLEDAVVDLEIAAEEADGLAQQELARTAAEHPGESPPARQARLEDLRLRHIVELVDTCDADLVDEAKMVAATRYDAGTGRFDWQRGDPRELAVLTEMRHYGCEEQDGEESG